MPPNPNTSGHHQRVRSNAEIPAEEFRTLYEFELRLGEKLEKLRTQTKEDMGVAIALNLAPMINRLDRIDARLESGEEKFERQEKRLDEHSDVIEKTSALYKERDRLRGATTAVQKAQSDKPSTGGWISVDKIPMILTAMAALVSGIIGSIALLRAPPITPQAQTQPVKNMVTPP